MNHLKTLFSILVISLSYAQDKMKANDDDVRIIELTFANEYDSAKVLIQQKINLFPSHPKYYFFMSAMYFQQTVNVSSQHDLDIVLDSMQVYGQKAIDLGEEIDNKTPDIKFYLGASYGYLGRYFASEREWFKAYRYGSNGKDYLEEVIEDDPTFYDAYLGLGIFNYYSAKLNGVIKFFSWIVGMSGDEDLGMKYINIALEKGTLSKLDAKFFLTYIYRDMEYDQSKVAENLNFFRTNFPKNKWAINFEIRLNQRMFKYDQIEEIVTKYPELIFDYNLADYYINAMKYEKIKPLYDKVIERNGWRYRSILNAMGMSLWMSGNQSDFVAFKDSLDKDSRAYKNFNSFSGEFSELDAEYYQFRKLILFSKSTDNYESTINKFLENKEKFQSHRIHFLTGVYHYKKGDYKKAESYFLLALRGDKENYDVYRTLAIIYLQHNLDKENVALFLDYLNDFDDRFLNFLSDLIEEKYNI